MNRREFLGLVGAAGASITGVGGAAARPMKVLLWCWDARMTWDDEPEKILTKMAAAEQKFPYPKRAESYGIGFRFHPCNEL